MCWASCSPGERTSINSIRLASMLKISGNSNGGKSTMIHLRKRALRPAKMVPWACFPCFEKGRECNKLGIGMCVGCDTRSNKFASAEPVCGLQDSNVKRPLDELVRLICHFETQDRDQFDDTMAISILLQSREAGKWKYIPAEVRICFGIDFFPTQSALRAKMDAFVGETLGLGMLSTDAQSTFIQEASLAGGYLNMALPAATPEANAPLLDTVGARSTEQAARQLAKFSIFRFAEILDKILGALRGIGSPALDEDESLNIIAAAGILYCEIKHIQQSEVERKQQRGLGKRKFLIQFPELEQAFKIWLEQAGNEISMLLGKACPLFGTWYSKLAPPIKGAKQRNFNIARMVASLYASGTGQDLSAEKDESSSAFSPMTTISDPPSTLVTTPEHLNTSPPRLNSTYTSASDDFLHQNPSQSQPDADFLPYDVGLEHIFDCENSMLNYSSTLAPPSGGRNISVLPNLRS